MFQISYPFSFVYAFQNVSPNRRPFVTFRNKLVLYGTELSTPCPTTKLDDHLLSAVRHCLFNIFGAILCKWRPSPPSANWGTATVVTGILVTWLSTRLQNRM